MEPETVVVVLSLLQGVLFFVLIFVSGVTDALYGRVYNLPCGVAVFLGLCIAFARGGWWLGLGPVSLGSHLVACLTAFAIFFLFYLLGGIGAGDVKLMAGIGALTGWKFTLWAIANTAFAGVALAVGFLLWRGDLKGGLWRGARSMFRWRYDRRPAPGPEAPDAAASSGDANAAAADATAAPAAAPQHIPYAVAICLGALWTVWLFLDRSEPLPFG